MTEQHTTLDAPAVEGVTSTLWQLVTGDTLPPAHEGGADALPAESIVAIAGADGPHRMQVVVAATPDVAGVLARAWLGAIDPDPADAADAVGEAANQIGGGIKVLLPGEHILRVPQISSRPDIVEGVGQWPAGADIDLAWHLDGGLLRVTVTLQEPEEDLCA